MANGFFLERWIYVLELVDVVGRLGGEGRGFLFPSFDLES